MNTDMNMKIPTSVFIRVHPWLIAVFVFICFTFRAHCADVDYRQVFVSENYGSVRVRLPLTYLTGKVRVKEKAFSSIGIPVAPTKTLLGDKFYIEWQIGYDIPDTNSPTVVPEIKFTRNGETKYGHELSRIIFDAVQIGVLSTNDLAREIEALKKIQPSEFEENQPMQVETSTNIAANGFQGSIQRLPEFIKTTPHGSVQIQLKQKQRAVGFQAMVYVCLPMNQVLDMKGNVRQPGPALPKETVYYDFNADNAAFILDIVHAFGIASQQHNDDIRQILEKILEVSR